MKRFYFLLLSTPVFNAHSQLPVYVPQTGLIAWYNLDGNANDQGPNANHAIVYGAIPTDDRFGNPNSAYLFNEVDSIVIPNNASFDFQSSNAFSISYWCKVESVDWSKENVLFSKQSLETGALNGWNNFIDQTSILISKWSNSSDLTNCEVLDESSFLPSGYVTHIVHIYDNGELKTYADNILTSISTTCTSSISNTLTNFVIGNSSWSSPNTVGFNGVIDEVGIWNRALSECDIEDLWQHDAPDILNLTLSLNGGTLTPNQSNPNVWNWVDCNNNYQVIAGANGNSYTPTVSGNYAAVFTTSFNCYIYSECVNVQVLGLNETEYNSISLSPNPSSNFIHINNGIDKNVEVLSIKNSLGQEQSFHMNNSNQIDISNFPIGIYFAEVADYQQLKFIKK